MPGDRAGGDEISTKEYIDAKVAELEGAIGLIETSTRAVGVPLREYIEAIFEQHEKATELAEQEREKAANALRIELARSIEDGDENLLNHINQQVQQIREALLSAEKLEIARIAAVKDRLEMLVGSSQDQFDEKVQSVAREQKVRDEASERAILKAETANEKRFESVNEFRNSLSDQTASFLPREVAETQFAEMRRAIQELTDKVNKLV